MHRFGYVGGTEYGMGGPVGGSIFCDEVLISDCLNDPVFFPEQQVVAFLLYVEGWNLHTGIKPLVGFHTATGDVWTIDPDPGPGRPVAESPGFPTMVFRALQGRREYDVAPHVAARMDWRRAPDCEACREVRRRWTCESCPDCAGYYRTFWRSLFPKP